MQTTIGRFNVIRKLGQGAQGEVYLASDPHLDREVAIKTLAAELGSQVDALLQEARIVAKLLHPNIVTLFDAGDQSGKPYLVYAYVQGKTLEQLLKSEGRLALTRAVQIVCYVLDALQHAHQQNIVHLDLKPANIMMSVTGNPMIMDFGIAQSVNQLVANQQNLSGSPCYMAPELWLGNAANPKADLFSVGMVLYELVTGTPAATGDDIQQILRNTAHAASTSPSERNADIDGVLESIILKALAKSPQDRYADAAAMKQALLDYLDPGSEDADAETENHSEDSTLNFLLRRMRSKSDFPALSSTISEINRVTDNDSASTNQLTQVILRDFSLTNKLLKLVNTVTYGQFGGKINTISKAVVILGFETVRNVAMALILFEFLQNKAQAANLKDEVLASFFSGIVAAQLPAGSNTHNAEETMICSMFRNLGKLLTVFYFFEESQEVSRLMEQNISEDQATIKILGLTYNQLGIGIAKNWNFPPRLLAGMRKLSGEKITKVYGELDNLSVRVNMGNDLCMLACNGNIKEKSKQLKQLAKRYESALPVTELELRKALENGLMELLARAGSISMDMAKSKLIKNLRSWIGAAAIDDGEEKKTTLESSLEGVTQLSLDMPYSHKNDAESMLTEGIQEVTNTLIEEHKLNDLIQMILEVMHRAMKFQRTLIFVRDAKQNEMAVRFGFGNNSNALMSKFRFSLPSNMAASADVFHLAISKGTDLLIEDIRAENIADKIPLWYYKAVDSQSFLLLPIMIKGKAIGLFYADMEKAHTMQVSPRQLSLLRTLRNQAVLALKHKA